MEQIGHPYTRRFKFSITANRNSGLVSSRMLVAAIHSSLAPAFDSQPPTRPRPGYRALKNRPCLADGVLVGGTSSPRNRRSLACKPLKAFVEAAVRVGNTAGLRCAIRLCDAWRQHSERLRSVLLGLEARLRSRLAGEIPEVSGAASRLPVSLHPKYCMTYTITLKSTCSCLNPK